VKKPGKKKIAHISFELEENAVEIFEEYLDKMDVTKMPKKDSLEDLTPAKSPKKSKKKPANAKEFHVDLHGLILDDAKNRIENFINQALAQTNGPVKIKVITGKGIHSGPDGSVLPEGIWWFVKTHWSSKIISLEDSPADVKVGGLPIRGHFSVILSN